MDRAVAIVHPVSKRWQMRRLEQETAEPARLASHDEMVEMRDVIERVRSWDPRGEVKPPASATEIVMDAVGEPLN